MGVGGLAPDVGQAGGLGTHHDGGWFFHVSVVVQGRVLKLRGEYLNMPGLEPGDGFLGGGYGYLPGEHSPDAGPDEIRVVEVGEWVTDDNCIRACGVGTPQHGPEVAGFFDTLKDNHQRILAECQAVQSPVTELDLGDDTLCATSVGDLAVKFVWNLDDADFRIPAFGLAKKVIQFLLGQDLPSDEQSFRDESRVKAVTELPAALDHKQPLRPPQFRLFLKCQQLLDLLVLRRCDVLDSHNISNRIFAK